MSTVVDKADCPDPSVHGAPFRYCPNCTWTEADDRPPRHPGTEHLLSLFEHGHLPDHLAAVSGAFGKLARETVDALHDGPELTTGLRKLLEAKDCFVRQAVIDARTSPSS